MNKFNLLLVVLLIIVIMLIYFNFMHDYKIVEIETEIAGSGQTLWQMYTSNEYQVSWGRFTGDFKELNGTTYLYNGQTYKLPIYER